MARVLPTYFGIWICTLKLPILGIEIKEWKNQNNFSARKFGHFLQLKVGLLSRSS